MHEDAPAASLATNGLHCGNDKQTTAVLSGRHHNLIPDPNEQSRFKENEVGAILAHRVISQTPIPDTRHFTNFHNLLLDKALTKSRTDGKET